MKQRIFILLAFILCIKLTVLAQNRIDNLVDRYSAVSTSKYTSAIERNPKTRAVMKVVKVLELSNTNASKFVETFRQEANSGDFSERKDGDNLIMTLALRRTTCNRIYMLKADDYYTDSRALKNHAHCNITIIVKYK